MIARIAIAELFAGFALLLFGAVLLANARWCFLGSPGCGIWEPVIALYAIPMGIFFLAAGVLRRSRMHRMAAVAYLPIIAIVVNLVGQFVGWW